MNARMAEVQAPIIPKVAELVRAHPGTISLGQGVVSYGPPQRAIERVAEALESHDVHAYKHVQGLPELLRLIEAKVAEENGIALGETSRILVTAGSNMAFMNAVLAIIDPGDEVILPTPYYFNHEMAVTMADGRVRTVPNDEEGRPIPEAIRAVIGPRTRAVVTISPNNPNGVVTPEPILLEINSLCAEAGIIHISDEAYEYFTYDGTRHVSPGAFPGAGRHTISLFSLSKGYGMAGWRIGYMVVPTPLLDSLKKIQDTILICPPIASQAAALGALEIGPAACRERIAAIAEVRQVVLDKLAALGDRVRFPRPDGAFYVFLTIDTDLRAMEVVERLVRDHGVAAIPGDTFGALEGCSLRVAFGALQPQTVAEGIDRFVRGIEHITRVATRVR